MKEKNLFRILRFSVCLLLLIPALSTAQEDIKGSKDHPLLTRMPGFYISTYQYKEFDRSDFKNDKGEDIMIEGKKNHIEYDIKKGGKAPSELQILRNYEHAIEKIGGSIVYEVPEEAWLSLKKDGNMIWIYVYAHSEGESYELTIVEKKEMPQEVFANAKSLARDINSSGHVSVYGIHFDFNKSRVKKESELTLKEIAKLLAQNPELKLFIVGHTDNVGEMQYNMHLSRERASAVVKVLVTTYGVSQNRLSPYGVGPLSPVASNETEDGRALNRRVELVKK